MAKQTFAKQGFATLRAKTVLPERAFLFATFISPLYLLIAQKLITRRQPYSDWEMLQV